MKRKRPSFTERGHGYRTFSDLLEDAQRGGLVSLRKDERSGSYIITSLTGGRPVRGRAERLGRTGPQEKAVRSTESAPLQGPPQIIPHWPGPPQHPREAGKRPEAPWT